MTISTVGLDLAKNVFQVHAVDHNERVVVRKQLRRNKVLKRFAFEVNRGIPKGAEM